MMPSRWSSVVGVALSTLMLAACGSGNGQDRASQETVATVTATITASPSQTPSATSTPSPSPTLQTTTSSPTSSTAEGASTFGPYEAPATPGVTILDSTWDTSLGDGYAKGGAIYYNSGPGLGDLNVSVDLLDASATAVGGETSGSDGRVQADSFGIMIITSTSSPPNTHIEVTDVSTEDDFDEPLSEGATATAQVPKGGGQIPVMVTNHESDYDLETSTYINFAFLDSNGKLLSIDQGTLSKPVRPGETVAMFVDPFLIDVPARASQVLASIQWGY